MWIWLLVPVGYIFGSVSSAIIICRCLDLPDPREQGSKNPGATNVLRYGGKKAAGMTLFGDMLKGLLPVLIASALGAGDEVLGAVGVAAFLGHLYPLFFGFKGGKGVATGAGAFLGFAWLLGAVVIATWLVLLKLTRISSLSAIVAAAMAPVYAWFMALSTPILVATGFIGVVSIWRHRLNIQRLISGEEGRVGR